MGVDITLAGIGAVISIAIALGSFWRSYRRDKTSDTRQYEQRIRALEDSMLQLDHYAAARIELPRRLIEMEYKLSSLQASVERLERNLS
jgi:hypothetical protein